MSKATYIINYLINKPLRPKDLSKLAKYTYKINGSYKTLMYECLPSAAGYYGDAFNIWRGHGLIKTINGLVTVTSKGKRYKNNPYSKKIPPGDYTVKDWQRVLKQRRAEQQIKENEKKKIKFLEGRKIEEVRYLTAYETHKFGWQKRAVVLILDNGDFITPSIDEEGNEAGALFTENHILGRL